MNIKFGEGLSDIAKIHINKNFKRFVCYSLHRNYFTHLKKSFNEMQIRRLTKL